MESDKDNVLLVDAATDGGIEEITATGIRARGKEYACDIIVFATGFDAMTGPLKALHLKGRGGRTLENHRPAKPVRADQHARGD